MLWLFWVNSYSQGGFTERKKKKSKYVVKGIQHFLHVEGLFNHCRVPLLGIHRTPQELNLRDLPTSCSGLTLPLRYLIISDSRKMYNLLTLVDRLDFTCKRKRKSILVTKNEKKKSKKIFTMVERVIYTEKSFSVTR